MIFASREALKSSSFNLKKTLAKLYAGLIFFVTFFDQAKKVSKTLKKDFIFLNNYRFEILLPVPRCLLHLKRKVDLSLSA
jgi:hypothetical protein